jgi:hypothetical protein
MMQVYDLRGDVGAGRISRCSAALRVLYSLKSMTGFRIRACARGSFLDEEDRSRHGGLYEVVTYFTGSPERAGHSHRIETLAARGTALAAYQGTLQALTAQAPQFQGLNLNGIAAGSARYARNLATFDHGNAGWGASATHVHAVASRSCPRSEDGSQEQAAHDS